MVFSSITFLFYFLPIVLFFYFIVPFKLKNLVLLLCSLFFYFYGENTYILILLFSCVINYIAGLLISESRKNSKIKKMILILSIILNVGLLGFLKYTNFIIDNVNGIFNLGISLVSVTLPIGISFFTFQTLSYVIDVYNGKVEANKSLVQFSCYVCLFPQLIAGPIVRYKDVNEELNKRRVTFEDFGLGVRRFIIGLAKKVLIANVIGQMINNFYGISNPTVVAYVFIAFGYSLQIYFDFSGYSDMAIGLGRMLGFNFLENFNYPFIASSITDFWRRWHMSLSSFFRDYVYIPLGGNRKGVLKHLRNILVVWFLTGLWHGASWNFIIWGLYFGIILILEKYLYKDFLDKHKVFSHIYTTFLVLISFVIFSVDSFSGIVDFMKNLIGISGISFINKETLYYVDSYILIFIIAMIGCTPLMKNLCLKFKDNKFLNIIEVPVLLGLFVIVVAFLIDSSFNPFLYFRF